MTDLREAAQQALEALDRETSGNADERSVWAMLALRAALEQPEQEELQRKSDAIQRLWKERDELRAALAAEREACAKVCDALVRELAPQGREALVAGICAAAIRGKA